LLEISKPSARSLLRSVLRLTSFCDIELHSVLELNAFTRGEAPPLIAVTPGNRKKCVRWNGIKG